MKVQKQSEQFKIFAEQQPGELTGTKLSRSSEGHVGYISPPERGAINSFYSTGFYHANEYLRGSDWIGVNNKKAEEDIPHLDSLMHKVPEFTQPVHLHRGTDSDEQIFGQPGDKIGKVFHEKGYTCSTSDKSIVHSFGRTHVHIHAGPGTKALNEKCTYGPEGMTKNEDEFTFPRGQRFKVESDEDRFGTRHIHLKALRPDEETNLEHFSRLE